MGAVLANLHHPYIQRPEAVYCCFTRITLFAVCDITAGSKLYFCIFLCVYKILVLYISQLSNQIAERVDNIFHIIHVFVDNIVSIDTRLCFCFDVRSS